MHGDRVTRELQETFRRWNLIRTRLHILSSTLLVLRLLRNILKLFYPSAVQWFRSYEMTAKELNQKLEDTSYQLPKTPHLNEWQSLETSFKSFMQSNKTWEVIHSSRTERVSERTPAVIDRARREITFEHKRIPCIKNERCIYLPGWKGDEMYFYETCIILLSKHEIVAFDFPRLHCSIEIVDYIEDSDIPKDTVIVRQTWQKANVNGTMDKRYRQNTQLPIVQYALITITLSQRNYRYLISNVEAAEQFYKALQSYVRIMRS